jgi:hypothetical protein
MIEAAMALFNLVKQSDPEFVIYPYTNEGINTNDGSDSIELAEGIPTKHTDFQRYFHRAFKNKDGGNIHCAIRAGHSVERETLLEQVGPALKDEDYGLYIKALQVPETTTLGWLLWSTRSMDRDSLINDVKHSTGIDIGLRWRGIANRKTNEKITDADKTWALHVEVDAKLRLPKVQRIQHLWSKHNQAKPRHAYMLLVPEASKLLSQQRKAKARHCKASQQGWAKEVVSVINRDLLDIDIPVNGWAKGATLHDAIMNMHPVGDPTRQLFTSVHDHYSGHGYIFECTKGLEVEAQGRIDSLLPCLIHNQKSKVRLAIRQMFDPGYRATMKGVTWNPTLMEAMSPTDSWMDEVSDAHATQPQYIFDLSTIQALKKAADELAPSAKIDDKPPTPQAPITPNKEQVAKINPNPPITGKANDYSTFGSKPKGDDSTILSRGESKARRSSTGSKKTDMSSQSRASSYTKFQSDNIKLHCDMMSLTSSVKSSSIEISGVKAQMEEMARQIKLLVSLQMSNQTLSAAHTPRDNQSLTTDSRIDDSPLTNKHVDDSFTTNPPMDYDSHSPAKQPPSCALPPSPTDELNQWVDDVVDNTAGANMHTDMLSSGDNH